MLTPEERAALLEESRDSRRAKVLRRFRVAGTKQPPAQVADRLSGAFEVFAPFERRRRRRVRGRTFLL